MQQEHPGHQERRRSTPAEVRLTDETIEYLETRIASAVGSGIKSAMTEDTAAAFWMAGLNGRLDAISKLEVRVIGGMQLFKPTPGPDNQTTDPLSGHP